MLKSESAAVRSSLRFAFSPFLVASSFAEVICISFVLTFFFLLVFVRYLLLLLQTPAG